MTPAQQYAIDGDYSKLSEDEINGIVAEIEGVKTETHKFPDGTEDLIWWHPCGRGEICPPDYLHDWSLTGPLVEKYGLRIEPRDIVKNWCAIRSRQIFGVGDTPQAAICHAVCEIWREKKKEKEDAL